MDMVERASVPGQRFKIASILLLLLFCGCNQEQGIKAFPEFNATLCEALTGVWENKNHVKFELQKDGKGEGYNQLQMIWSCDSKSLYIKQPNEEGWDDHSGSRYLYSITGNKLTLDKEIYTTKEFWRK